MEAYSNHVKTRIFLYEFVWSQDLIRHIIRSCDEKEIEICAWAVRSKDIQLLLDVWPDAPVYEAPKPSNSNSISYEYNLLRDFSFEEEQNIRFLLDREGVYQNNLHSSQVRYEVSAWVETLLARTRPNWLLFPDVPHNIFTYLIYLSGRRQGIGSLMIRLGMAPHLFTLSETIERGLIRQCTQNERFELSPQTSEYLNALRFKDVTSQDYMVEQRQKSKLPQIFKRSLAKGLGLFSKKSMGAVLTYVRRWHLKQFYESICEPVSNMSNAKPYIVVFLHLQPERSTTPEGGVFAQQWLIVQMLSTVCSMEGWNLYVKEHPSTFMFGPKLYRGKWFYNSLRSLPNVSFISTSVNSTVILKNSKAVATVTGTVGIEAVAKGIPALLFGESPFIGCPGTFRIKSQSELRSAIVSIKEGVNIDFDDVKRFYSAWEQEASCHNTKLGRTADHNSSWRQGVPQAAMFSKMLNHIQREQELIS